MQPTPEALDDYDIQSVVDAGECQPRLLSMEW